MGSKFGKGENMLYRYISPEQFRKTQGQEHPDPIIEEFSYGDTEREASMIRKNVEKGNYIFFHTTIGGQRYITAYYVVQKKLEGYKARADKNLVAKYRNPHLHWQEEIENWKEEWGMDDIIIFGDPEKSRDLRGNPLPFDCSLGEKLEFDPPKKIPFDTVDKNGKSRGDSECITSATRMPRYITDHDVEVLLSEIGEIAGKPSRSVETFEEESLEEEVHSLNLGVVDIREKEIEEFIYNDPFILDEGMEILKRQYTIPGGGRIDLLLQDKNDDIVVLEIKEGLPRDDVLTQLLSYMKYIKKESPSKRVKGAIVCENCSKRLYDAAEDNGIDIYYYGGRFVCDKVT